MKNLLLIAIITFSFLKVTSQETYNSDEAHQHIGETITICDTIVEVAKANDTYFLNFGKPYPNQTFTAVIFNEYVSNFTYDLKTLENKKVCITQEVTEYKNTAQFVLEDESEIEIEN